MSKARIIVLVALLAAVVAYLQFDLGQYLTLAYMQSQLDAMRDFTADNLWLSAGVYFLLYVVITALSVPGAAVMTLLGGAIFGFGLGLLLVSFASSIGATLAFLVARLLLRDWVQSRFGSSLKAINAGIERDGAFYLFTLRMIPVFPFFLINLVMGLTPIKTLTFYWISQVGMLLGTAVYVNAGVELGQLSSLSGLLNTSLIFSFVLLAMLPWLGRGLINMLRRRRAFARFTRPKQFDTNMVVIGAGSGGLVASIIAAGAKAKVTLIEKHKMGGDCLNTGCVPSKTLIASAKVADTVRNAEKFGLKNAHVEVDFKAVMARVQQVIKTIEPHDSVERFTSLGVDCVQGEAYIRSPWEVEVNGQIIRTRAIVVATGARPLVPDFPGLDQVEFVHSDNIWELDELPARFLVLGGGPIGCELAQSFARLGSQVTLLDQAEHLMGREDTEVSEFVEARFRQQGINLLLGYGAESFGRDDDGQYLLSKTADGNEQRIHFDKVLIALGRKPNVSGFGLEEMDVALTSSGALQVDDTLSTSCPTIFACGDVAGPYQFTHMASFQAWYATLNALAGGLKKFRASYRVVPHATFTDPEVARVGLNEREAQAQGVDYEITRYELDHLDRALAEGYAHGFVKVLTVPGNDRILGATIVGSHAGELIGSFVFAMTHNMGLKTIGATTHIYPTMLEANRFAANAWRSARVPQKLMPVAEGFFRWLRH
ncbi:FAD-dependent oxidoreductase [Pseudohongiella spirulinae]|uniref:Putative mercuric reductase n=1 Tax=Pseudohongiella spirulinae TaxID=1249552 RepID=A0A0S2KAW2_9GAMM|nr:bifunctional TVP38/TMEM64 family protein/FAD-dependent oxidoreductase [Pseudohongiella spirulinae]ALO45122.1 putative mercuric reductase [Pseudohongiella spirulinae]